MVPLPDDKAKRIECYGNALRNWNFQGYVRFKSLAQEWIANELPEYSLMDIAREFAIFVDRGGLIDERKERRPEYVHHEYHYDLRLNLGGRYVYFETILIVTKDANDPDDPVIVVVNAHDV